MHTTVNHPAPTIIPGVELTAERFTELYAWVSATAADTAFSIRRPFQYGLLIPYDGKPALSLEKKGESIIVSRCVGITPAGSVLGIFDDIHTPLTLELPLQDMRPQEQYHILIELTRRQFSAFGPESTDLPYRPVHAMPACQLHVQAAGQAMVSRSDAFCIGKLQMEYGEWQLAEYIPPCAQIGANPMLRERYRTYLEEINELLALLPQIVVNTDAYHEKAMVELREFALQLGSFSAFQKFKYQHLSEGGHPFDLFEFWAAFARQASFLLQCLKDRPGFYNLLNENTRQRNGVYFTAQSWDAAIQQLANLNYNQQDILGAIQTVDIFLETVTPIFKALAYGVEQVKNRTVWEKEKRQEFTTW